MTSIETTTRQAQRSGDIVAETMARLRSGVVFFADHSAETYFGAMLAELPRMNSQTFPEFFAELTANYNAALAARKATEAEQADFARRRRLSAGECTRCANRGKITVHVPSGNAMIDDGIRTCPSCNGKAPEVTLPFTAEELAAHAQKRDRWGNSFRTVIEAAALAEARELFADCVSSAEALARSTGRTLGAFTDAARVTKGARVRFDRVKRARFVTFDGSGDRVADGTEGCVTWVSGDRDRFGVTTDDGLVFFTASKNLGGVALNGWQRVLKLDAASLAKVEAVKVYETTASVERGDKVTGGTSREGVENTKSLKVFWVGPDRKSGRQRFGCGKTAKGGPFWGYSDELKGGA